MKLARRNYRALLLLPVLSLAGCGMGAGEASNAAARFCGRAGVQSVTAMAVNYGKTGSVVIVCRDGRVSHHG